MTLNLFALTALLVVAGATVSALAGFGFMIVTVPFLILLYPPKTGVALALTIGFFGILIQWVRVRSHVNWRLALLLSGGALVGVPIGSYILAAIDPNMLKILVGVSTLLAAFLHLRSRQDGERTPRIPPTRMLLGTGVGGGILAATTGQSGLPVALLMSWTRLPKDRVRATLVTYFVLVDIMALTALAPTGVMTWQVGMTGVGLIPCYLIGLFLGDRLFHRTDQMAYRKVILAVLTVAALTGVLNGIESVV